VAAPALTAVHFGRLHKRKRTIDTTTITGTDLVVGSAVRVTGRSGAGTEDVSVTVSNTDGPSAPAPAAGMPIVP
jgi:hypothetical protein